MSHSYQCAACHGTFVSERSDADAVAEAEDLWGVPDANESSEMAVVCDECFKAMTAVDPPSRHWRDEFVG